MLKSLKSLFAKPRVKFLLIRRFSSRLRLAEYRSQENLVKTAQKFLIDPEFQPMLDVLRNEAPSKWMLRDEATTEDRAVLQAKIEGYELAIANLEAMGVFRTMKEAPEPTYEQPEEERLET